MSADCQFWMLRISQEVVGRSLWESLISHRGEEAVYLGVTGTNFYCLNMLTIRARKKPLPVRHYGIPRPRQR